MSNALNRRRLALHVFVALYLVLQLALPLHGLLTDKLDSRGDFSWNMYADDYTCTIAYALAERDGTLRALDFDRYFRDEASSTKVLHRDRLPEFHDWLCEEVVPAEASLGGLVTCSLNGGLWVDLVDPAADLCRHDEPRGDAAVRRLARTWDGFWTAQGNTLALDLFRILFAAALMFEVHTSQVKSLNALDDGLFHLPYLGLLPLLREPVYHLLHAVQSPVILFLGLGLFPRLACLTLLAIQSWLFFADRLNYRNHPYLILLVLFLLALAPLGRSLSLPALLNAIGHRAHTFFGARRPLTWQRLIQVQLCIAYFFAALHKLHPAFLQGEVLAGLLRESDHAAAEWPLAALAALACLSVALELFLPFGLWFPRTRPLAVIAGAVFHLAVAWALGIWVFSAVMIAGYVLFFDAERPAAWLRGLASRVWGAPAHRGVS